MHRIVELTTTVETEDQAQTLARALVEERLAACVQITGPIQSIYRWQGQICEGSEFRCTVKSKKELTPSLLTAITQQHPYETPEILVVDVADCAEDYAAWLVAQLRA
jgi:periplasmic divalent cation tolerance protein